MTTALLFLGLILLNWFLVDGIRRWAQRRRTLDVPNERSSHARPTPRGGGLAIVLVVTATTCWLLATGRGDAVTVAYVAGGVLIAAVSWADDLRGVSIRARLFCHIVAALVVTAALIQTVPHLPLDLPWWLAAPLITVWLVGMTNLLNFMDGIDGLVGGQALVASVWWLLVGALLNSPTPMVLALVIAAASVAFLLHNWAPARIFLGDVGSTFLGFTFAVLPLLDLPTTDSWQPFLCGALALWPVLFDSTITLIRRLARHENVFQAHRSHLYQRLVIAGMSHAMVSACYLAFAILCATCAYLILHTRNWLLVSVPVAAALTLLAWVGYCERRTAPSTSGAVGHRG